jgi:hypothetical protein
MQEYVQPHDKLLIPHELMEMNLVTKGMSQEEAHILTCKKYDYPRASNEFYHNLQHDRKAKISKSEIISGAITHGRKKEDWNQCL